MTAAWTSGFVFIGVGGVVLIACSLSWLRRGPVDRDAEESHQALMREVRRQP